MEISKLPWSVFSKLEYISYTSKEKDKSVVVYNNDKFSEALIENGYLTLDLDRPTKEYKNYKFYFATEKFTSISINEVIEDLTGKSIEQVMKEKVISITDVPYDYEDCFEALNESDGFIGKVDIGNGPFRQALDFHGFTSGAGANGVYSTGTNKLEKYTSSHDDYKVIEIITGKTQEENDKILAEDKVTNDIKLMKEIAEKYGYYVLTEDEYETKYEG